MLVLPFSAFLGCFFGFFFLTIVLSHGHFSHRKPGLPVTGKASCDSRAIQPVVHAGCFGVSIIHWILTRTVSTDVNACDCTWGCKGTVQESALKADSGRKIPSCTGELNLLQPSASPMIHQLSYIPTPDSPGLRLHTSHTRTHAHTHTHTHTQHLYTVKLNKQIC